MTVLLAVRVTVASVTRVAALVSFGLVSVTLVTVTVSISVSVTVRRLMMRIAGSVVSTGILVAMVIVRQTIVLFVSTVIMVAVSVLRPVMRSVMLGACLASKVIQFDFD
jgi:hypothetical protein